MTTQTTTRRIARLCERSPSRRAVLGLLKAYAKDHAGPVGQVYIVHLFRTCKRFPESTTRAAVRMLVASGAVVEVGIAKTRKNGWTKLLSVREGG
jgi:hypothetical protein